MVFFTCDACGASLKKNQVEKHYLHQCRRCNVLTCIDCQKDFPGDTYKEHTKCISEEEKYSAKGWQPKASANKGLKKQEAWMDNIRAIQDERGSSLDGDVRKLLDTIIGFDNIPRKRNKFVNFVQNAVGRRTQSATIDKTWEVFEEAIKRNKPEANVDKKSENGGSKPNEKNGEEKSNAKSVEESLDFSVSNGKEEKKKKKKDKKKNKNGNIEENGEKETNGETEMPVDNEEVVNQGVKMFPGTKVFQNSGQKKGAEKRKREEEETDEDTNKKSKQEDDSRMEDDEDEDETSGGNGKNPKKFDWELNVRKLLEKKGSMKVKRLKKKVVDEFVRLHGDTVKSRIQLESKLEKKLKKNKEFKYVKDSVALATSRD